MFNIKMKYNLHWYHIYTLNVTISNNTNLSEYKSTCITVTTLKSLNADFYIIPQLLIHFQYSDCEYKNFKSLNYFGTFSVLPTCI